MEQSGLGTTMLVDEIVSDALQRLQAGDILPDESSMSFAPREPVARSTSVAHPVAHWGHRSYTDDILKSFINRPSEVSGTSRFGSSLQAKEHEGRSQCSSASPASFNASSGGSVVNDSGRQSKKSNDPFDNSICTNFFEEQDNGPQLDTSEEFVSAEKLLDEFDADERQCQEANLFMDGRPVPFECASLAISPEKVGRKQVQQPAWTEESYRLDSASFFNSVDGRDSRHSSLYAEKSPSIASTAETLSANNSVTTQQETRGHAAPWFDCGLPYFLGVILPGAVTDFNLPAPPCSTEIGVTSFLNNQSLDLCQVSRSPDQRCLRVSVQTPPDACGNILITLDFKSQLVLRLAALSMFPVLAFPDQLLLAPNTLTMVSLRSMVRFSQPLDLRVQSKMITSKEVKLLPDSESLSFEVMAKEGDTVLDLQLLNGENKVASLQKKVEVRFPQISLRGEQVQDVHILAIKNEERFPVDLSLKDDLCGLEYSKEVHVPERQTVQVKVRRGSVRYSQSEPVATFTAKLLSPVQVALPLVKCRITLAAAFTDLKPDLARFVWLAEKELVFTMSNSQRSVSRKPSPWRSVVRISPCSFISKYVQVLEEPGDPTKVLLRVTRPPSLTVGTLRFFRCNETAPYGLRYPILAPEKPSLLWHTASSNASSRVYQMPVDGKLRVSNNGQCGVFVMVVDGGQSRGQILAAGASAQLTIEEPCRILYGLECWRCLVRYRTAIHESEIEAQLRHTNTRAGLEPKYLMREFQGESIDSMVNKRAADKLPTDCQSLVRLYQLFMTTVEEVRVQRPEHESSTFFAP